MKLIPFATVAGMPDAIDAEVERSGAMFLFRFFLTGFVPSFAIPGPASARRTDRLWETTCFEAFIRGDGDSYAELNFSPSGAWASYVFDDYRLGMRELDLPDEPVIALEGSDEGLIITARLRPPQDFALPDRPLGLSAVVEEKEDGEKSYWALAHPADRPDFHHPDCFVAKLP
jgi:hypothetical protein